MIIPDWLSSVAGTSPGDYLSVSTSIHPSAAVDISKLLSSPSGYPLESRALARRPSPHATRLSIVGLIRLHITHRWTSAFAHCSPSTFNGKPNRVLPSSSHLSPTCQIRGYRSKRGCRSVSPK